MLEYDDKVVLITGAGSHLGRELAVAFASFGASVAANDINPLSVDETVDLINKAGGKARPYVFDIAKRMPVQGLVEQVHDTFGRIDCLVNNASVMPDESLLKMDEWEFHRTLDVNLAGPFFTMQQVGRIMKQQAGGVILNILSEAVEGQFRNGHAAYSTTQFGLLGLTRTAAQELAGFNIRVYAIYQGCNELFRNTSPGWNTDLYKQWITTVLGKQKAEIPELVCRTLFLCSQAGSGLKSQVIFLGDGK